ncbi:MAG TPA: hypothetical protein PK657_07845 [Legionella sp.]|nr:hypothetical protein [Legionella sp.]
MPEIKSIETYLKELEEKNISVVFCKGFRPLKYKGQVCKLVAGLAVQHYLYDIHAHSQEPLPLHKDKGKKGIFFNVSLRQRAKKEINSQVGEVYGPGQMKKVFDYNEFKTDSYYIKDEAAYKKFLLTALKQYQPVICYFDVTARKDIPSRGEPDTFDGEFEHAAIIVGYYYKLEELHLIAAQFEQFFDILADRLFLSSSQLNPIKRPERYKKYYPIPGYITSKTWMETKQLNLLIRQMYKGNPFKQFIYLIANFLWLKDGERISNPPKGIEGGLVNTLTIISGDKRPINLYDFNKYLININEELS